MPLKFWASFDFFFFCLLLFFFFYSPFKSKKIMWPQTPQLFQNTFTGVNTCKVLEQNKFQFSVVTRLCPTLCDPMNRSTPGLLIHHQIPEFTQTHVHWVGDAIQPSYPLLSSSPPALNLIRAFSNESVLRIRWPKYWSFSLNISPSDEYSGLNSFRMDWLDLLPVQGTLKSLLQHQV